MRGFGALLTLNKRRCEKTILQAISQAIESLLQYGAVMKFNSLESFSVFLMRSASMMENPRVNYLR